MTLTRVKTRRGCQGIYEEMATGSFEPVLATVLDSCAQALENRRRALQLDTGTSDSELHLRKLTSATFHLALSLVWQHSSARHMYAYAPPFAHMPLASCSSVVRHECLEFCRRLSECLKALEERRAQGDKMAASFWRYLVWPALHFPRELLLQLEGCGFGCHLGERSSWDRFRRPRAGSKEDSDALGPHSVAVS